MAKQMKAYRQRDRMIRRIGFQTYRDYLASPLWAEIRHCVLAANPDCIACGEKATQVHHGKYHPANLSGVSMKDLYAVCRDCHVRCEYAPLGGKRTPKHATEALLGQR